MKKTIDELEEALHCLKHEIKHLKSAPFQNPVKQTEPVNESTPVDLTPIESDLRCLNYEVRRLKQSEQPDIIEPFESNPIEDALRCMKHEIKQLNRNTIKHN